MRNAFLKQKLLATTVFAGLAGSLVTGLTYAQEIETEDTPVVIEQIDEDDEARQERVVVTGSRLLRPSDNTIPITTISSEDIELRQFTNSIEAIEEIPFVGLGTNLRGNNTQFGDNTANPDILNLQTNRTLTLINGRRFVSSNQATVFVPGNANGSQVDLTLINPSLIESTDLLIGSTGGATYGADAVAGVVNIKLKSDFDGLEGTARYGITDRGDGQSARLNLLAGENFLNDRANITVAAEYFTTDGIRSDDQDRLSGRQLAYISNPLDTGRGDGIRSNVLLSNTTNPLLSQNGLLVSAARLGGSTNTAFFPNSPNEAFTAAGLGTPFEYAQTPAGRALDPLLFVGTFSPTGTFLTVPNTDPKTSAFLPRRAVPLQFSNGGDLVPFNIGAITPPIPADQNTVIGGDGQPNGTFGNITSDQERITFNALTRFDVTDDIIYSGEYYAAYIESSSFAGPASNSATGSSSAGSRSLPIYLDDNPFLSAQALSTIADLEAQGLTIPTLNGERVLYLSRSLFDVTGVEESGSETTFFRTVQSVKGEFEFYDRNFNWDIFALYGMVETDNFGDELLDVEFALATDVVEQDGQIVCRQQTLDAPEAISTRNPNLGFINTALDSPVTPTQAQIDACQPLNLFGFGAPSQAAIDYVTTQTQSTNESSQFGTGIQLGGELIALPAGPAVFSAQAEYRKEENEFIPGDVFGNGLARNTRGRGSKGESEFLEYGLEVSVPVYGGDFSLPGMRRLVFDGAYRVVERDSQGGPFDFKSNSEDSIYNIGLRWSPTRDLTFRASKSEAVRSPSIVELFGAGVTGFSGLGRGNLNPCDEDVIDGDGEGVRRANCERFVEILGLPSDYLDGFQAPGGSAPAAGASNPGLENEESESWTAGFIYEPDFIDGLTLTLDYYSVDLTGEIGLTGLNFDCFDSPSFPEADVGGFDACDALVFAIEDPNNPGSFIVPTTNPVNGAPIDPIANPGAPAQDQVALTSTFSFFPTLNLGATEIRSWYGTAAYSFDVSDLTNTLGLGSRNYGSISLNASAYLVDRFDESNNGTFSDLDPRAGEPGDPELTTILRVTHRLDNLTHSIQWLRDSAVVENVEIPKDQRADQPTDFARPSFNTFNYNISYDLDDRWTLQFVANNLLDERWDSAGGLSGDTVGRRYFFGVRGRF